MARSTAKKVQFLFAEDSEENQSVHFSFQNKDTVNLQIPAVQLTMLIENLERVKERLTELGVPTGTPGSLLATIPQGWWD